VAGAPLLLIAAGGTGGHMFPAQALAEAMLRRGWRVRLSTDERGARYAGGFPHVVEVERVASGTPARGGPVARLAVPLRIAAGVTTATLRAVRERPRVVVGFGGYPAIPALAAAWLLRVPRMIHEQNGVLGRVNEAFARRVHRVACGTWPTELPSGVKGVHTGNPVRAAVRAEDGAPYVPPGEGPIHVLVIGGSQGARVLSKAVPKALAELPAAMRQRLLVSHQARPEDAEEVERTYSRSGIACDVQNFFRDVPKRLAQAQLVISRSGASSVADISVIGRPSILIPYAAAAGDHQTANARALSSAQAAILIPESKLAPGTLSEHIERVLTDAEGAAAMAAAARAAARPDAAERLADLVEELAERGR